MNIVICKFRNFKISKNFPIYLNDRATKKMKENCMCVMTTQIRFKFKALMFG